VGASGTTVTLPLDRHRDSLVTASQVSIRPAAATVYNHYDVAAQTNCTLKVLKRTVELVVGDMSSLLATDD